ncbi:MAG: hypothetical protein Q9188_006340 [Gyalolechia gomerana]
MTANRPRQAPRKIAKRPPSYYKNLRQELAAKGRTAPKHADNTKKSKASLLKKWSRFCSDIDEPPKSFLQTALAEDFKTFLRWTLDRYPRVRASESLNNYWRVLNMHILDQTGRELDDGIRRDVTNYKKVLVDEYKLRRLPKKRGVSSVDDLYHILFYHWVHDEDVYRDEQQRNYVPAGILMASYFGCRPVSMFDTRLRFEDDEGARKSVDHAIAAVKPTKNVGEDLGVQDSENGVNQDDDRATLASSDYDPDTDMDASTCGDNDSNSDSGTDDGVTIMHTKGEDNRPREKTFIVEREENPILCLLDHLLSMALYDEVFVAESLRNVSNIFQATIPSGKKCLQLKTKREVLDTPVFREPGRAEDGYRTSPTEPLRSGTWLRYLRRLGRNSGLEQSFTQYCARRGLVNAVNSKFLLLPYFANAGVNCGITADKAPSSVRDQIFDHQSNAVCYYLDREVRFNTQAAFLGRPSDEVVQKELSKKLANNKRVVQLGRRSKDLTEKLREKYRLVRLAPLNDPLLEAKKQVDAALHREKTNRRNRMLEKARKRHFRNADTATLESQFIGSTVAASGEEVKSAVPLQYDIPERSDVVRLTCEPMGDLTDHEKHIWRIEALRARIALCSRQESRGRRRPRFAYQSSGLMTPPEGSPEVLKEDATDRFPLVCKPTQCIFCLGNEHKSDQGRTFEYARPNKMMDEVERHLKRFAPSDPIMCPHPTCRAAGLVLPGVTSFKNHTATVHKIFLRV